jgi:hypothetical protein
MVDDRKQLPDEDRNLAAADDEADWRAWPEEPFEFPKVVIKGMTPTVMRRIRREVREIIAKSEKDDNIFSGSPFIRVAPLLERAYQKIGAEKEQEEPEDG